MTETKPFCRRCLLEDMPSQATLASSIRDLIALLPEQQRASQEEQQRRLAQCRACDALRSGMCALCGCYVELRAAKARMGCPALPPRWVPEAVHHQEGSESHG
ncbi:MAG: DUF6171 family protein [Aristaeellaceae bacterium]